MNGRQGYQVWDQHGCVCVQLCIGHKMLLPNPLHTSTNSTISTCIIQHFCHSLPIFHMLPFHHLILHQPYQLLPLLCHTRASQQKVLHIFHFSTLTILTQPFLSTDNSPSASLNLQACCTTSQFCQNPSLLLTKLRGGIQQAWRLRWADGELSVERKGCVRIVKVRLFPHILHHPHNSRAKF